MNVPMCEHGERDWALLVDGDPEYGRLLTNATGRGCRPCLSRLADFWFRQDFVSAVVVVPTADLEAVTS